MTRRQWILLAEDNECDADLALRALSANDAPGQVIVARDGVAALDCLYRRGAFETCATTGPPAVVLLDLKMPRMDGFEALRRIRADPKFKTVPVVMFSSSREESDVTRCYDLGANGYVVKPVDFKRFTTVIRDIERFWVRVNEVPAEAPATRPAGEPGQPAEAVRIPA